MTSSCRQCINSTLNSSQFLKLHLSDSGFTVGAACGLKEEKVKFRRPSGPTPQTETAHIAGPLVNRKQLHPGDKQWDRKPRKSAPSVFTGLRHTRPTEPRGPENGLLQLLPDQAHFPGSTASQNAEVRRKSAKQGEGTTNLSSTSAKARGPGYLWDREAGRPEVGWVGSAGRWAKAGIISVHEGVNLTTGLCMFKSGGI